MKYINLLLTLFLILGFTQSCTDLEEEVFDRFTEDNFFQNQDQIVAAFGSAYTSLYGYTGTTNQIAAQEITSDEMVVPTRGNDWNDGGNWRRLHQHQYGPEDDVTNSNWNFLFAGVNTCNRLLFQFDKLQFDGRDAVISELKALRAVFYLWILDIYGNVPIVDKFDVPDGFQPETASRSQVYAFVEAELKSALPNLTKDVATSYGRVNYYAAQAALAKLYLNAQVYSGTAKWSEALAACDDIINSGKYSFFANYADIFSPTNGGNPEMILAIPYDRVFAQGFNLIQQTLHYASQATYNSTDQPWNGWCTLEEFYNSYEDSDVRKSANFLVGPQFSSAGVRLVDPGAEANDPDGPPLTFTAAINELGPNTLRQAGARVGKFKFELGSTANQSNDFPIYRYTDILLMKAECHLRLNQNLAAGLNLINQIRNRAGVSAWTEADYTLANVLAERGREMFFEAHRRSDLIRFGEYNKAWWAKEVSAPTKNIFPIPKVQLDNNPKLKQNPGY